MNTLPNIYTLLRATGVLLLVALLVLLTTLNFFQYNDFSQEAGAVFVKAQAADSQSVPGSFPNSTGFPDEKAPDDRGGFSEEYLHEGAVQGMEEYAFTVPYPVQPDAKLPETYGGLFTPPPEC